MLSLNARARVPNKQVQAPFDSAPDLRRSAETDVAINIAS
jgi:hypothetical protein